MRKLGDYTLTRRLGVGGMGEVWMGRREALGGAAREVAIKLLSAERASNAEARRMFLDEARLSMLLRNSNIVQVHDVAETSDGTCYMVLEFIEGLNLAELSDKMRQAGEAMPDSITAYIIGEVLKGLAHAHELRHEGQHKTVVHRDVSPHNVMVSVYGEVKIMDFGIARVASEDTSGVHVKGKLRYMPPEQLRGETREPTLDLFAVGAMLHELLDGVKFRSNVIDEGRLFGMILDGEVPPLARASDSVPKELDELRQLLLAAKPRDRIQSARLAFRRLTFWPGYRDTRFELDELVRRYVGNGGPQVVIAGTSVLPSPLEQPAQDGLGHTVVVPPAEVAAVHSTGRPHRQTMLRTSMPPPPRPASPRASESVTGGHAVVPAEGTTTAVLPNPDSVTGVAEARDSGTDTAVASRAQPASEVRNHSRLISAGLAVVGLGFVLLGANAMFGLWGKDEPEIARAEDESPTPTPEEQPPAEAPEPPPVEPESPGVEAAPQVEEEVEADPVEPTAPTENPKPSEPTPVEVDDEAAREPERDATPGPVRDQPVVKSKVTISLGSGVAWAEVKIGGRTFELDGFAGGSASTRLTPGSHGVSCRLQVNGAWQAAERVKIPEGPATVKVGKGCKVTVE